jgi:hypothetical protein
MQYHHGMKWFDREGSKALLSAVGVLLGSFLTWFLKYSPSDPKPNWSMAAANIFGVLSGCGSVYLCLLLWKRHKSNSENSN